MLFAGLSKCPWLILLNSPDVHNVLFFFCTAEKHIVFDATVRKDDITNMPRT